MDEDWARMRSWVKNMTQGTHAEAEIELVRSRGQKVDDLKDEVAGERREGRQGVGGR